MPKKILFLDILADNPWRRQELESPYGGLSYPEHFRQFTGIAKNQFISIDAFGEKLPDPAKFRAIILGGSGKDPVKKQESPWILETYKFIRKTADKNIPILGICGGLQFGELARNAHRRRAKRSAFFRPAQEIYDAGKSSVRRALA